MELPCKECRGLCCGPVPVTGRELSLIKKAVRSMPEQRRRELESQQRYFGTCIFYDLDRDLCAIHSVRPSICKAFGHYQNLICFRKPEASAPQNWIAAEDPVGVLSVNYTWKSFQ